VKKWEISQSRSKILFQYGYGYDALGRRTSVTNSGTAFDEPAFNIYGYNSRNELRASNHYLGTSILDTASPVDDEERAYNYDPIGNRINAQQDYDISASAPITSTYVTNSLNQYESVTSGGESISLDYDDDGNLIHKDGVQYVFNCENRLVEVSPLAPVIGDTKVAFAYDYMGRRYLKQSYVYSAGEWSLVSTSTSIWEGWNRIQEKVVLAADSSNEEVTSYVWGLDLSQSLQGAGGVGGLLAVVDADSDVDFYLYDANGNVGQLISATDGTLHATYEYGPFGRLLKSTGSKANENPYRFSTKPMDAETGLYYYGYRYLDVDLGRWVSRDPIGERGGWNLYGFVGNIPIGLVDFLGNKYYPNSSSTSTYDIDYGGPTYGPEPSPGGEIGDIIDSIKGQSRNLADWAYDQIKDLGSSVGDMLTWTETYDSNSNPVPAVYDTNSILSHDTGWADAENYDKAMFAAFKGLVGFLATYKAGIEVAVVGALVSGAASDFFVKQFRITGKSMIRREWYGSITYRLSTEGIEQFYDYHSSGPDERVVIELYVYERFKCGSKVIAEKEPYLWPGFIEVNKFLQNLRDPFYEKDITTFYPFGADTLTY
jgi:RHS repeat-associated protein